MERLPKYKALDCSDEDLLAMPSGAVHLWLTYTMKSGELDDEAYLSLRELERITGMDRKTIIKWRDYLKAAGRIAETGATAADKYGARATQGSHAVAVLKVGGGGIPPLENPIEEPVSGGGEFLSGKVPPKVIGMGFGVGVASSSPSGSKWQSRSSVAVREPATGTAEEQEGEKPKTETKTPKKPVVGKDGVAMPEDLLHGPDNEARVAWLAQHDPSHKPVVYAGTPEHRMAMRAAEARREQEIEDDMLKEPEQYVPVHKRGTSVPGEEKTKTPRTCPHGCVLNTPWACFECDELDDVAPPKAAGARR